ncbi:type VII secretion integral membrane protein EccD [Mycolicibacterium sp. P1-5]|uniref:type VII secretion integral membrane protein EccD n=1 Tax=Mycolicibacterium sp. P1-5 TaxID=2024617 RepID=UPI0011F00ADF|nr:type VII secretion integral membrane protein EccD [Mycolicibacterium sp. P1-5]KAA0105160.1 type VII secretion integral membrane protein EccD [Mycolicibacterium sp. P1-5]
MVAIDETCQVSIRTSGRSTDVALPARIPIGELMPALVDLVGADQFGGADPHLTRVCGERLDRAATLAQCAIPDGELLILEAEVRPLPITRVDPSAIVKDEVAAMPQPGWRLTRRSARWCTVGWVAAVLLVLLGHPIVDPDARRHPVIGALAAIVMLAGAVAMQRTASKPTSAVSMGVLAATFAGLTAALASPGQPGMPTFLLAMAAIAATSLVVWRLLGCAPSVFLPMAVTTMAASVAATGAVIGWWHTTIVGPMLVTASVAVLAVSARLAVHGSGLARAGLPDAHLEARARTAHHRLTAIVVATAWTAALGAVLTAATTVLPVLGGALIAILSVLLLVRAVRNSEPYRAAAQGVSSGIAATALASLCVEGAPQSIPWLCGALLLITACAVGLAPGGGNQPSAAARRAISTLDLALGAAIVPASCAAGGAFAGLAQVGSPW